MSKLPASYRIGRGIILVAVFVSAYILWTYFVTDWLRLVDRWIVAVAGWAETLNPL